MSFDNKIIQSHFYLNHINNIKSFIPIENPDIIIYISIYPEFRHKYHKYLYKYIKLFNKFYYYKKIYNYDDNNDFHKGLKNFNEQITYNNNNYNLDSCIITNYNISPNIQQHVIAGIKCNKKKYVYNGWQQEFNGIYQSCPLMSFDWNLNNDYTLCLNTKKCNLFKSSDADLCFSFAKGHRILIYTKINQDSSSLSSSSLSTSLSSSSSLSYNSTKIKKNIKEIYDKYKYNISDIKKLIRKHYNVSNDIINKLNNNRLRNVYNEIMITIYKNNFIRRNDYSILLNNYSFVCFIFIAFLSDNLRKIVMKSFEKLSSNSINFVNNELIKIATNTKKTFNNDEYLKKLFLGFYEKYDKYIYQEYKDKDKDGFIDTYEFRMYIAKFLRYLGIKCLDIIYFNNTILFNFDKFIYNKSINEELFNKYIDNKLIVQYDNLNLNPDVIILFHSDLCSIYTNRVQKIYNDWNKKFHKKIQNYNIMNSKLISKETKNDIINFQNIIRYKNKEYKLEAIIFLHKQIAITENGENVIYNYEKIQKINNWDNILIDNDFDYHNKILIYFKLNN